MAAAPGQRGDAAGVPERLLVSLLALGAVAALVLLRSLDDNRLTSWRWVLDGTSPARLLALAAAGIALANLAVRLPLPGRRPAALLFLSAGLAGALSWGEPEVVVDASRYFTQAKHLETTGLATFLSEWGRGIQAWTDLPLVPLLHGLAFRLAGESRAVVQALGILSFAATAAVTCRLGTALWDEEVGFAGGALLLAIPYLLAQVPLMLVDVPAMFFLALALLAVLRALEGGGAARILLASLAVFAALLTKYSTWLLLTVLPVAYLVRRREGAPGATRAAAAVALISGSLLAAAVLAGRDVFAGQVALLASYQAPGLRRWGESPVSTFLFQVHPFLTAAALASLWVAFRRRDWRIAVVLWPALLLLALRVHRARYWIPAFPMLALAGAYGLRAVRDREVRRLVVGCAVSSSLVVALFAYLPFLRRTSAANLARAGAYLDSIPEEVAEVFTAPQPDSEVNPAVAVPILDLHTGKRLLYAYDPPSWSRPRPVEESPLRFTWEWRNPAYYQAGAGAGSSALVVVSAAAGQPLPEGLARRLAGYRLARTFAADEGVFQFRTVVEVYRKAAELPRP